ncbi:MAG: hypothetical protein ACYDCO_04450 [Armatimonadota bacterium]
MKSLYTPVVIAALLTFGSVAMAYPTFNAETGIVALPNAYTADSGSFVGAADLLFNDENTVKVRVLYGLNEKAEIGASLSSGIVDRVSFSAKYRFTDDPARFNLASGGSLTLAENDETALDLYLVATQSFNLHTESGNRLLGTFGVHFVKVEDDDSLRPFIGVQYALGNWTEIAAEYQLKDGNLFEKPLASVVLRQQLTPALSGQIGLSNATGFGATGDVRLFVGAQYTFTQGR